MSKFFVRAALAASAFGLLAAQPATAAEGTRPAEGGKSELAPAADQQKVCVKIEGVTGSRVAKRQCRTKAEWEAMGVELGRKG